ncbi:MAG: hypothetical protein GC131_04595 [Alphaproteobacteria bacterium]|nr:hypothetical protein [Alphaproteobacteria bacterium]
MSKLDPAFLARATYKFWHDDQVRFSDLDALGHANNLSIAQYFENIRVSMFMKAMPEWPHCNGIFVLVHISADYLSELHYPALVQTGLKVTGFGASSMKMASAVFRDETVVAACETVSVFIDETTRKPVTIPQDMRGKILAIAG